MVNAFKILRRSLCALLVGLPLSAQALDDVKLRLTGENDTLLSLLEQVSGLKALEGDDTASSRDILAVAQADYARLVEALYAQGYYSVQVAITLDGREAARIDPFAAPAQITKARIIVDPGPAFRFGQAEVAPLPANSQPVEGFRRGAPAEAGILRDAAQGAVSDWRQAGHAKAEISGQSITANHAQARLDAVIRVAPGPRLRFGDAAVTGDTRVKPARVRQIAGLPRGEVFDPDAVEKAATRLRRTGTFRSVTVTEAAQPRDGALDMEITVIDRKPRRIGGGAELTTIDGLTLTGYWLHRNLFGGAEMFRADASIGQLGLDSVGVDYELRFRFEKPAVYGPDTLFFAEAEIAYSDEPDYLEETAALTLGVSREFNEHLTGDLGVGYRFSRVTDYFATGNPTRELRLFYLPLSLTFDNRDVALDATKGFYLRTDLTPFYEINEGYSGLRAYLDGRAYRAFGDGRAVAAARLQLGAVSGVDAPQAPPGYLFYSGGGGTVRGQPYQSLGASYEGDDLGGLGFAALSAEMRFAVTDKIGVVGFADMGWVGAELSGEGDWHAGAGLGLRYKTPVGPIRVDLAGPVAGDTGDGVQLYIGIGQAF